MKSLAGPLLFAILLALGACGGGGGSDRPAPASEQNDGADNGDHNGDDQTPTPEPGNYRVSGAVYAEHFSDTDSDTNDPNAPAIDNNRASEAQPLGNPVVLGGFASAKGSGLAEQRYQLEGDTEDWFSLSLASAQSIRLSIHEHRILSPLQNDLDLYLYRPDNTGNPVESSTGITGSESIRVADSGDYLLRVHAKAGISGYTLSIDSSDDRGPLASPSIADNFTPGELIVKWKQSPAATAMSSPQAEQTGPAANSRLRLYQFAETAKISPPQLHPLQKDHPRADSRTLGKLRTLMEMKALNADPAVDYVEPNYHYRSLRAPSDPLYLRQWHYQKIQLPQAWDITTGSGDAIVAVLDTGIYSSHPDFENKLVSGYDFISDPENARDGDGIDSEPEDPGDQALQNRSSWHGTHVAGTAGALTNNTSGVSGAGWHSRIMPLRVLGVNGGKSYDAAQALRYAAGLSNDSNTVPAQKAAVINMSFGGPSFSQTLQDALTDARDAGVILVAAAGNDNSDTPVYPAAMQGVIAVGATDFNNEKAPYSNFGDWISLTAPGGDMSTDANGDGFSDGILSTHVREEGELSASYAMLQGTSMASPHVSGVFALMKAVNPQLTPNDLDALLANGQLTTDLGEAGRDSIYGYGLLDAYKAVQAAGQEITQPVIAADPEVLNFGNTLTTLDVEIRNIGAEGAAVSDSPQPGAAWISTVEALSVDGNGFGNYRVRVDRSEMTDGIYSSEVVFPISGAEDYRLPVNLQVGTSASGHYTGFLYILLLKDNASGYETVQQQAKPTDNGEYTFEFTDIAPGDYYIAAGSDLNANGYICDPGEACGYYPASGQDNRITIEGNMENLNFVASYPNGVDTTVTAASTQKTGRNALIGKLKIQPVKK